MIIGNGDIASVLPESEKLFFASGVSNSAETSRKAFRREEELLMAQPEGAHLVYFSSLSIFYKSSPYTQHKILMERLVKEYFPVHCIVRLGNIDWGTNPHTLINYLRAHPGAGLRDEYRFVISKDEFLYWIDLIPNWSSEFNMPGRRLKVKAIYEEYVRPYHTVL